VSVQCEKSILIDFNVLLLTTVEAEAEVEVEVTLRLTVSQSVCLGIEYPCGTCDQILFPVGKLLSEFCQSVSQYVLVSSTLVGLVTRYYFLSECCCLRFAVLYLWGVPSDERLRVRESESLYI
jgi:hypothetical protein